MNRLWGRVSIRAASVGLLVLGVVGGVYVAKDREVQQPKQQAQLVFQTTVDESSLLRERQSQHAADRAYRNQVSSEAAVEAATAASAAASKARAAEKKVIAAEAAKKAAEAKAAAEAAKKKSEESSSGGSTVEVGPIPDSCSEFSGNRATGCALMLDAGFGIDQFPCLNKLWNRESGWDEGASNPSSGAYGIPQALPGSKMASVASDWRTNAATQIKWGLGYIEGRYDSPCGAWSHSESVGWY
ncbi:aggregation-promoting factor C-terminal-like domain-containing protein [Actinoplanes sp. RD1]|uniref:aggregation-promoting factor C-terminal-like domain-containing protein n=1 Tax=Actinoplanes sp. RD1 TaxID=3064538 RepID=UPI002741D7FA|nr:lytic transglycosylase domain-containing protein [Actinoplanes sp. RD1]